MYTIKFNFEQKGKEALEIKDAKPGLSVLEIALLNVRVSKDHSESEPALLKFPQTEYGSLLQLLALKLNKQPDCRENAFRHKELRSESPAKLILVWTRAATKKLQLYAKR
jgi:hypothetical protein